MPTKISKWFAIAALIVLIILWRSSDSRTLLAGFAVCAAAVVATIETIRARNYMWMTVFLGVALLFNPLVIVTLSKPVYCASYLLCLVAFLLSFRMTAPPPRLSMASITDRTPGSESL
jgi:hypothetical protein